MIFAGLKLPIGIKQKHFRYYMTALILAYSIQLVQKRILGIIVLTD